MFNYAIKNTVIKRAAWAIIPSNTQEESKPLEADEEPRTQLSANKVITGDEVGSVVGIPLLVSSTPSLEGYP